MIDFEDNDIAFITDKGEKVLTNEYVRKMRETDLRNPYKYAIIAQDGGQEDMLAIDADIKICGGSRGGSKSFSALLEGVYDIEEPDFHALILRKEKDDLQSLVSDSYKVYSQFGTYNKSKDDMTWNFYKGGWLKFSYYEGTFKDFKDRFQGRQFAYVCIDEGTQCPYKKFKYLLTNNRNASGLRNRFWITCNPDPESWVRKFIDWWVGEDGQIIFTMDTHDRHYMESQEGKHLPVAHCIEGEDGWQLYGKIADLKDDNDLVFSKHTFGSYELGEYLHKHSDEFESVEFAGVVTNICVISNIAVTKAAMPEVPIIVDASCVASNDLSLNDAALEVMESIHVDVRR